MQTRLVRLLAGVVALTLLAGCQTGGRQPRFIVDDSQLSWLSARYRPLDPARPPCTLSVFGAGYITVIAGRSPLVADSFSTDTEHARWSDAREERIGMSPAEARGILQLFADAGVMSEPPRPARGKADAETPGIAIFRCRLNGQDAVCMTTKPELLHLLNDLLDQLGYAPDEEGEE